jgi:hypothetical protein
MIISDFTRMEHPPHSPDFAPCDFFLFGDMYEKLKNTVLRDEEELSIAIWGITTSILGDLLLSVSSQWLKRPRDCIDTNGDYVE